MFFGSAFTKVDITRSSTRDSLFFWVFKAQEDLTKTPFYTIFLGSRYHPKKKGGDISEDVEVAIFWAHSPKDEKNPTHISCPASKAKTVPMPGSQKPEFEARFFSKKTTMTSVQNKKEMESNGS